MIRKNISDITYADIKFLLDYKIDENDVLDYKEEMIDDQKLVKHVCAFANTRGGHIIFGVKESGKGGCPVEVEGLDMSELNKERLEQIILSNVVPRLDVKIKLLPKPNTEKSILLIQIPDSHQKPHQSNITKKFYKRFQFESAEMTESEVSDRYRNRFSNYEQVNGYIKRILVGAKENAITANIIVIPSNIEHRLIDASDHDQIERLQSMEVSNNFGNTWLNRGMAPFSHGLTSNSYDGEELQIHRNGCIQHVRYHTTKFEDRIRLGHEHMTKRLMQTLQFTNTVLSHYNYFGDVKIIVTLETSSRSQISVQIHTDEIYALDSLDVTIEREHPLYYIETKYEQIASSIMNEIFNHYGVFRCELFDEEGNYDGCGGRKRKNNN